MPVPISMEDWTAMMDFFDKHLRSRRIDRTFERFPSESELDAALTQPPAN